MKSIISETARSRASLDTASRDSMCCSRARASNACSRMRSLGSWRRARTALSNSAAWGVRRTFIEVYLLFWLLFSIIINLLKHLDSERSIGLQTTENTIKYLAEASGSRTHLRH